MNERSGEATWGAVKRARQLKLYQASRNPMKQKRELYGSQRPFVICRFVAAYYCLLLLSWGADFNSYFEFGSSREIRPGRRVRRPLALNEIGVTLRLDGQDKNCCWGRQRWSPNLSRLS